MIANLKLALLAHLGIVKLAAAKAFVGAGVLVGSAASGLVATEVLVPEYGDAANALINQAADAEAGLTSPVLRPAELPLGAPALEGRPAASIPSHEIMIDRSQASNLATDGSTLAGDIPQVRLTAKRMSLSQKLAYDIDSRFPLLASRR